MLKGSKTAENLMKSFAGECQARTRYTYYSSIAKKEGYIQIANIFMETAEQEKEHAKIFLKFLKSEYNDEEIEIKASYPVALHEDVWHNRAESYPFRMFPCGMFTPPLWRQAATPTTAPKLLPFFVPPADCACGVPGRPLPPCGVPEIFGDRLRRPLRGAGRNAPPKSNEQGKSVTIGRISLKSIEGINHITNT